MARANSLDQNFFARLLWRESLFDAGAVSPAGAQGIAQFMPGDRQAARSRRCVQPGRGALRLGALPVRARPRLRQHRPGRRRLQRRRGAGRALHRGQGRPAAETRAYVHAITGHSVEAWRDAPPATLDLSLAKEAAFQAACIAHAANRGLREFRESPPVLPWGAIVASNREREGAERQVARLQNRYAGILRGEPVSYTRGRMPGMPRPLNYAQIGRNSRAEAEALCDRLRGGRRRLHGAAQLKPRPTSHAPSKPRG